MGCNSSTQVKVSGNTPNAPTDAPNAKQVDVPPKDQTYDKPANGGPMESVAPQSIDNPNTFTAGDYQQKDDAPLPMATTISTTNQVEDESANSNANAHASVDTPIAEKAPSRPRSAQQPTVDVHSHAEAPLIAECEAIVVMDSINQEAVVVSEAHNEDVNNNAMPCESEPTHQTDEIETNHCTSEAAEAAVEPEVVAAAEVEAVAEAEAEAVEAEAVVEATAAEADVAQPMPQDQDDSNGNLEMDQGTEPEPEPEPEQEPNEPVVATKELETSCEPASLESAESHPA